MGGKQIDQEIDLKIAIRQFKPLQSSGNAAILPHVLPRKYLLPQESF
jgi:hypothetical protein